jgi:hypothetical protein
MVEDADRTATFGAIEKLVAAFERHERQPSAVSLADLKVAVGGLKRVHRQLLEGLVEGIPHQPDPEPPIPWWQRD